MTYIIQLAKKKDTGTDSTLLILTFAQNFKIPQ
jgi:hypothetical protein